MLRVQLGYRRHWGHWGLLGGIEASGRYLGPTGGVRGVWGLAGSVGTQASRGIDSIRGQWGLMGV